MRQLLAVLWGLAALSFSAAAGVEVWQIDPAHSAAQFTVRHMMISNVKGEFGKLSGTVQYDPSDLSKTVVEATIEAASITTRVEARDNHLKSAAFFDVEKYPVLTFKSKRVTVEGPGKLKLTGELTMHGTTREVTLDVEGPTAPIKDPRGNLHVGASASTKVNRQDFGVSWNSVMDGGGLAVGNEVGIVLDVELVKQAPPAAK
jgi:polyisoprenoid-binding protein YceI